MTEHTPFDGTVPMVVKLSQYCEPRRWLGCTGDENRPGERFATWQEAMDFALSTEE